MAFSVMSGLPMGLLRSRYDRMSRSPGKDLSYKLDLGTLPRPLVDGDHRADWQEVAVAPQFRRVKARHAPSVEKQCVVAFEPVAEQAGEVAEGDFRVGNGEDERVRVAHTDAVAEFARMAACEDGM